MASISIKEGRESESICRLCLTEGENYQLIFIDDHSALSGWIENLTTLKIIKIPNAPAAICLECEITLQNFESYREMCLTNDRIFKEMFSSHCSNNDQTSPSIRTPQVNEVKITYNEILGTDILNSDIPKADTSEIKIEYPDIQIEVPIILNSEENNVDIITGNTLSRDPETSQNLEKNKDRPKPTNRKKKPKICRFCGKAFMSEAKLTIHIRTHTKEKPFKCNECDKSFTTNDNLKQHRFTHSGLKPFACDLCPARFSLQSNLRVHKRIHDKGYTKDKKQCTICKEFVRKLPHHYRTVHNDVRLFQCEQCPQAFNKRCHLVAHIYRHTKEKPYVCSQCGKAFAFPGELTIHTRFHTQERPYNCESCNKAFHTSSSLAQHIQTHSNTKPFSCEICQASFKVKRSLLRHKRSNHVKEPQASSTKMAVQTEANRDANDVKDLQIF